MDMFDKIMAVHQAFDAPVEVDVTPTRLVYAFKCHNGDILCRTAMSTEHADEDLSFYDYEWGHQYSRTAATHYLEMVDSLPVVTAEEMYYQYGQCFTEGSTAKVIIDDQIVTLVSSDWNYGDDLLSIADSDGRMHTFSRNEKVKVIPTR